MRATFLLAALCFASLAARADELQPPITVGQRVATCGHSFHVFTYRQAEQIAQSAGLKHEVVGLSSIGGSTVKKHWDVPEEKSAVKQVLKSGKADVLTLSPIWLPEDAIESFVKLGVEHNPALRADAVHVADRIWERRRFQWSQSWRARSQLTPVSHGTFSVSATDRTSMTLFPGISSARSVRSPVPWSRCIVPSFRVWNSFIDDSAGGRGMVS